MDLSTPNDKGKKRALPLNLQEIATAIQNLPGDSSALLPTPAPFALSFQQAEASSSSFVGAPPAAATTPTDTKYQQILKRAARHNRRRLRRDIGRRRYKTKHVVGLLQDQHQLDQDRDKLMAELPGEGKDLSLDEVAQVWSAVKPGTSAFACDIPGTLFYKGTVQILTKSLPDIGRGDNGQPREFTICKPGTVLQSTKYFKAFVNTPKGAETGTTAVSAQPMQVLQPRRQRQLGGKRPMVDQLQSSPPSSKRRLISRAVSLGAHPMQSEESDTGAVQFQPSRSSSAQAAPVTDDGDVSDFQLSQSVARNIKFDLISSISSCLDIALHLCKFLKLKDILVLYRTSRVFKTTFDSNLEGNVLLLARQFATFETISIFPWKLCLKATTIVPAHPDDANDKPVHQSKRAPTLRFVNMLVSRERKVRDIVSCLARSSKRLPQANATAALKKMWFLMDLPTNQERMTMLQDEKLFTDADLLTIQMFHVKMVMLFHHPARGPDQSFTDAATMFNEMFPDPNQGAAASNNDQADGGGDTTDNFETNQAAASAAAAFVLRQQQELPEHSLVEALLGQRSGFDILWNCLRRKSFRTVREMVELKVRYDYTPPAVSENLSVSTPFDVLNSQGQDGSSALSERIGMDSSSTVQMDVANADFVDFSSSLDFDADSSFGFDQPSADDQPQQHSDNPQHAILADVMQAVPVWEMGIGHLEGWGQGTQHLLRPDELVPLEAARRMRANPEERLDLTNHVPFMGVWGYRDLETGLNSLPTLNEMYISDDEDNDDLFRFNLDDKEGGNDLDDGENKENVGVPAHTHTDGLDSNHIALMAGLNAEFYDNQVPHPEMYIEKRCGNVLTRKREWLPWMCLKSHWGTLSMEEKFHVWWENHQVRLKRQSYTQSADNDQRASSANNADANADGDTNIDGNEFSYTQPDTIDEEADDADDEEDYELGSDFGDEMMHEDFDFYEEIRSGGDPYRALDETFDEMGLPSTPPAGIASSSNANANTNPNPNPNPAPEVDANGEPVIPLPETSENLPGRHKRLMRSYIRWALQEQDEVDEALLAQADMEYDDEELQHWDAFLADVAASGNPAFASLLSDDDGSGLGPMSDDDAPPTPTVPTPEEVLLPNFGSIGDVVRLSQEASKAMAEVDAARIASQSDDPNVASMACIRLPELIKEVDNIKAQIYASMEGEVFALEP